MRAELRESQVGPGAVLEVEGTRHRVVGSLRFDLDGTGWGEHCVTASGPREWVSLRPRGGPSVIHWQSRQDLFGEPDPAGTNLDGRDWTLLASGSLTYTAEGDTGTRAEGTCDFVEFTHGEDMLVFESFDGAVWEISIGRLVDPAQVRGYHQAART